MKHIRTVSVMKANLAQPLADFYFQVLRSYEDLKLYLKFEPLPTIPPGGLVGGLFGSGSGTGGTGSGGGGGLF